MQPAKPGPTNLTTTLGQKCSLSPQGQAVSNTPGPGGSPQAGALPWVGLLQKNWTVSLAKAQRSTPIPALHPQSAEGGVKKINRQAVSSVSNWGGCREHGKFSLPCLAWLRPLIARESAWGCQQAENPTSSEVCKGHEPPRFLRASPHSFYPGAPQNLASLPPTLPPRGLPDPSNSPNLPMMSPEGPKLAPVHSTRLS